jgi:hypothetical protein
MKIAGLAPSACAIQLQTDSYQLLQAVLLKTDAAPPPPLSTPLASTPVKLCAAMSLIVNEVALQQPAVLQCCVRLGQVRNLTTFNQVSGAHPPVLLRWLEASSAAERRMRAARRWLVARMRP